MTFMSNVTKLYLSFIWSRRGGNVGDSPTAVLTFPDEINTLIKKIEFRHITVFQLCSVVLEMKMFKFDVMFFLYRLQHFYGNGNDINLFLFFFYTHNNELVQ